MRVGVHTGTVLGGVLGQKRWQFDVWSTDVTVANKMESGGIPGYNTQCSDQHWNDLIGIKRFYGLSRRVHISQTTKDSLHGEFELEPGNGGERCEYLLEKGIDTYLVLAPKHMTNGLNGNVSGLEIYTSYSVSIFSEVLDSVPQRPGMLSNRNSNQLISTTASSSNTTLPRSMSAEGKQEASYEFCLWSCAKKSWTAFSCHNNMCYFCCQGVEAQGINQRLQLELLERETQQMYDLKNSKWNVTVSIIYTSMTDGLILLLDFFCINTEYCCNCFYLYIQVKSKAYFRICVPQNEESSNQLGVAAFCGHRVGETLLHREGEAERSGLLLLHDSALLHHSDGSVHRPDVSSFRTHWQQRWTGCECLTVSFSV